MPHYDPTFVSQGKQDLAAFSRDANNVITYGDSYLGSLGRRDGGLIYGHWLDAHTDCVAKFEGLVGGTKTLLGNASDKLQTTMNEYAKGEQANIDQLGELWAALDMSEGLTSVGPPPNGAVTPGPLPSTVMQVPDTNVGHWIFNVLSWPDYISAGYWIRFILGKLWQLFTGKDPWLWLWEWLGGDWEQIGLVADAWKNIASYFKELPDEMLVRMQNMFQGWYDSPAASAAGDYFAAAIDAIASARDPFSSLHTLYQNIAMSSFGFFQAIFSLIDAAVDAIITFLLGGVTVLEAVAAFFSGGAAAVPAAVTAVLAALQAVSTAWGFMMTAVYGITGLAALLGAATTDVNWVTLPEG